MQPDLVVETITVNESGATVIIKNLGGVPTVGAFWVDLYINPTETPTLNKTWDDIGTEGMAWAVTVAINSGETLTLTTNGTFYQATESQFGTIAPGTPIWVQVDAVNHNTNYGNVIESDETNNIFGPVSSITGNAIPEASNRDGENTILNNLPARR